VDDGIAEQGRERGEPVGVPSCLEELPAQRQGGLDLAGPETTARRG
jgi:hypothetical protein